MAVNRNFINMCYGFNNALQSLNPQPIFAQRAPTSADTAEFGTFWFYKPSGSAVQIYILTASGTWTQLPLSSGGATFTSLTVNGATVLNGALTVNSGSSAINIGTDAVAKTITLGNGTGATSVVINSGTGAINIGTNAVAHTVTIGNVTGASAVAINSGTGGVALVSTGTGDITAASADTLLLDSAGVLELNSSGAAISIGNDAVAQAINVGTGAAARTITVGNVSGATAVNVNAGTGGIALNANATGKVSIVSKTATSATTTVTNDSLVGSSTITGLTTASTATAVITYNNNLITASNCVLVSASNLNASTNGAAIGIQSIVQANGSLTITLINNGGGALGSGDDVHIAHMILG